MTFLKIKLVLISILLTLSGQLFALDLQQAKDKGLVGELSNGYLGSPSASPNSEVAALIKDINSKRKAKYLGISAQVGKPLSTIELLAGEKAISKTQPGHYVKLDGGGWQKK